MSEELHVAGIVVHAYPEQVERVARAVTRLAGAQVHATAPDGKLIVTLEAPNAREIAAQLEAIQRARRGAVGIPRLSAQRTPRGDDGRGLR